MYSCILFFSFLNGLDPSFVQSIIHVESKGNPFALGKLGDSGLMQIRHKYVPETQVQLFQSCTNVFRGTQLLGKLKLRYRFDKSWFVAYNVGNRNYRRLKRPQEFLYYKKVTREYFRNKQMPVSISSFPGLKKADKNDLRKLPAHVHRYAAPRRKP